MRRMRIRVGLICLLLMLGMVARAEERTSLFNEAWRFYRGDAPQAMQISYADERWQIGSYRAEKIEVEKFLDTVRGVFKK